MLIVFSLIITQGYLKQVHRRPDMFSKERIETVFGNIKEIYTFQSQFLKQLEECLDKDAPHFSEIGNCFLNHVRGFFHINVILIHSFYFVV